MSDSDLIRPHDPFSGREAPAPADAITEPEKPAQQAAPSPEPVKKPARRGRRPRRTPTAAEVDAARLKARR